MSRSAILRAFAAVLIITGSGLAQDDSAELRDEIRRLRASVADVTRDHRRLEGEHAELRKRADGRPAAAALEVAVHALQAAVDSDVTVVAMLRNTFVTRSWPS